MRYEIGIDNIILTCDIHSYIKKSPDFNSWESDLDYYGYEELELTVESALELDEDGIPYALNQSEIDNFVGKHEHLIERQLKKILEEVE